MLTGAPCERLEEQTSQASCRCTQPHEGVYLVHKSVFQEQVRWRGPSENPKAQDRQLCSIPAYVAILAVQSSMAVPCSNLHLGYFGLRRPRRSADAIWARLSIHLLCSLHHTAIRGLELHGDPSSHDPGPHATIHKLFCESRDSMDGRCHHHRMILVGHLYSISSRISSAH